MMTATPNRRVPLILATGAFAIGTDGFIVGGILPEIAKSLAVSIAAVGLLVTVFTIVYAVAGPVLAASTSAIPRRRLLIGAMGMFVLANLLGALAPAYWVILFARIIAGLGAAAYLAPAVSAAASVVPEGFGGRAYAMVVGGLSVATALGLPLGALVGQVISWRVTLMLIAGIAFIAVTGLAIALPEISPPPQVTMLERLRVGASPQMLMSFAANFLLAAGADGLFVYILPLASSATLLRGAWLTFVFVVYGLTSVAANIAGGRLTDRYGAYRVFLCGAVMVVATLVLFGVVAAVLPAASAAGTGLFLLAVAALSASIWGLQPAAANRFMKLAPQAPHLAVSLASSATYLGIAVGAAGDGLVLRVWSARDVGWVSAAAALLSVAFIVVSQNYRSAKPATARAHQEA